MPRPSCPVIAVSNTAVVRANEPDADRDDNVATETTTVESP